MRTATMRGRRHGSDVFESISLDHVPIVDQIKARQALLMKRENKDWAEVRYQPSDGPMQKMVFTKPVEPDSHSKSKR